MKVTDLVAGLAPGERYFCCEFFPPKTARGVENLVDRVRRLAARGALFVSVTWGAGGTSADTSLALAVRIQRELGVPTVLHLTCTNMDTAVLDRTLAAAADAGIENILALRGDAPRSDYSQRSALTNAADLVAYIRARYAGRFCIGVAGYPEGHATGAAAEQSVDRDLPYLAAKVRAGADFVITQLFYDADAFVAYERRLRADPSGLYADLPIIPGVMPINTYASFLRSAKLSHASIPDDVHAAIAHTHTKNDEEVKRVGVDVVAGIVQKLQDAGVRGVHFYTLNLEKSVTEIIERLQLEKHKESVAAWDDFTNGRYTDPASAAFGEIDGYGPVVHGAADGAPRPEWGPLAADADIAQLIVRHITNEIDVIPFSDAPLSAETALIQEQLIELNTRGLWTLASQPAANGVDSQDKIFGWGPPGGKIFQKAFVEFFVDAAAWPALRAKLDTQPAQIVYFSGSRTGPIAASPNFRDKVVATWGQWPDATNNSTIVSAESVAAWRDEAFDILRAWRDLYESGSPAHALLERAAEQRMLVTVIHEDSTWDDGLWEVLLG